MELNDIYLGDMRELIKELPNESIDLVVTDCPYRIVAGGISLKYENTPKGVLGRYVSDGTTCSNKWVKKGVGVPAAAKQGKMFTNNDIAFEEWLPDLYRVLKQGGTAI